MTVYVDDMYLSPMGQFGRMKMSHMMADTTEELLAMADQRAGAGPMREHFDVSMSKRAEAIRHGAVPMTTDELTAWRITKRQAAR